MVLFYISNMNKNFSKFPSVNYIFVLQIAGILSLFIIYIAQWISMITTPSLRTGTDFIAFYAGGMAAKTYGFSNSYKIELQQSVQEQLLGFTLAEGQTLLYNHIPYLLPILSGVVSENYVASFLRWTFLMLAAYIAGIVIFLRAARNGLSPALLIGSLLFFPFFQSILLGQDTALLFLGVTLWYVGMKRENDWNAVIGLTLTTVRPHICLALMIPFILYHRSAVWKFIVAAGALTLFSMILIGKDGIFDFIHILQISAGGTWYGMKESAMFNLIGMLLRIFPSAKVELIREVRWIGYAIGILLTTVAWYKYRLGLSAKLSVAIILALFFAPHLHYHDLTLLIIPLVLLTVKDGRTSLIPLGVSFLLLLLNSLFYVLPYLLYVNLTWKALKVRNNSS